jgi:hypothetical protein
MEEDEDNSAMKIITELSNEITKYSLPHDLLAGIQEGHL